MLGLQSVIGPWPASKENLMATSISSVSAKEPAPAKVDTPPKPEAKPAPPPKPAAAEAARENKAAAAAKSEQSQASERVSNQLNAQLDQTRASQSQASTQKVQASAEAQASTYKSIANDDTNKAAGVSVKA